MTGTAIDVWLVSACAEVTSSGHAASARLASTRIDVIPTSARRAGNVAGALHCTAMPKPVFFASGADLRAWLERHGATADELIVGYYKRHTGKPSPTWSESVDEALCFGWIDGVRRSIDADR